MCPDLPHEGHRGWGVEAPLVRRNVPQQRVQISVVSRNHSLVCRSVFGWLPQVEHFGFSSMFIDAFLVFASNSGSDTFKLFHRWRMPDVVGVTERAAVGRHLFPFAPHRTRYAVGGASVITLLPGA